MNPHSAFLKTLIILILSLVGLFGQNPNFVHLTVADGLPTNSVYHTFQDSNGFIWFSTDNGAVRYDGTYFQLFSRRDGLNTNEIIKMQEDSKGRIWIFNFNGTFNVYFRNEILNGTNTPFLNDLQNPFVFKRMYEDNDGNLYFSANSNREIFVLDNNNQVKKIKMPSIKSYRFDKNRVYEGALCMGLVKYDESFLLFNTGGVFRTDDLNGKLKPIDSSKYINRFFTTNNENVFLDVTHNESNKYKLIEYLNGKEVNSFEFLKRKEGEILQDIIVDSEGNIWLSSYFSGVYCYSNQSEIFHLEIEKPQNILQDNNGNIWISSFGSGVYKLGQGVLKSQHLDSGLFSGKPIKGIHQSKQGGIWAVDDQRLYLVTDGRVIPSNFHRPDSRFDQVLELNNQTVLVGESNRYLSALKGNTITAKGVVFNSTITLRELVKRVSINNSLSQISTHDPHLIFKFPEDSLFYEKGFFRILPERFFYTYFDAKDNLFVNGERIYKFTNGKLVPYEPLSILDRKIIRQQINLPEGLELFNVGGEDFYLFDGENVFELDSLIKGLPGSQIRLMLYHHPFLIFATNSQISFCLNPEQATLGKELNFSTLNVEFNSINDILVYENELVVASDEGLTFLPISFLKVTEGHKPIPYFRGIMVNDKKISLHTKGIEVKGNSKLNFDLGNIWFESGKVLVAYMLEGVDQDWKITNDNNIAYASLRPGRYVFKFKVQANNSDWSEELIFGIKVKPEIWEHPLFFLAVALILSLIVYLVLVRQKKKALEKQEAEHQILMLEQKALQSMMNPHFIFNSLGSIQNYILQNNPSQAGLYLSQFARLIRQNLGAIKSSMIPIDDEVERLRNYMELERLRMNSSFEFSIKLDNSLEDGANIPTMILQPVVENAIWHGLSTIEKGGKIEIIFKKLDEKSLRIVVEDNGVGTEQSSLQQRRTEGHLQLGMSLTLKRLELIGKKLGVNSSINYSEVSPDQPQPGTRVEIVVPYEVQNDDL